MTCPSWNRTNLGCNPRQSYQRIRAQAYASRFHYIQWSLLPGKCVWACSLCHIELSAAYYRVDMQRISLLIARLPKDSLLYSLSQTNGPILWSLWQWIPQMVRPVCAHHSHLCKWLAAPHTHHTRAGKVVARACHGQIVGTCSLGQEKLEVIFKGLLKAAECFERAWGCCVGLQRL